MPKLITDLAIMLLTAGVVAIIFRRFKQPLVLGYILAGFLVGPFMPYFFTVVDSHMERDRYYYFDVQPRSGI